MRVKAKELHKGDVVTGRSDIYGEPLRDRRIDRVQIGRWVGVTFGSDHEDFNLNDDVRIR